MRVVIRTDASLLIGTGHVMRCLTLAEKLRAAGANCSFVCRDHPGNLAALIRDHGFAVHMLKAPLSGFSISLPTPPLYPLPIPFLG